MKLSVVLATFNEEKNIDQCLQSVKGLADEIVVMDGFSTDRTRAIALSYKAHVTKIKNQPNNFHSMKQAAIDKAKGEWILQLDADEFLSDELRSEIKNTINKENNTFVGYAIPRKNWFLGKFLTKGGAYPDPVIRLFKKNNGHFLYQDMIKNSITTANVHSQIEIDGKVGMLTQNLIHNGDPDLDKYLMRLNRYTTIEAENLELMGMKTNFSGFINYMFIKPLYWFAMRFLRHRGYVDGWQGFLFALFSASHYPVIFLKLLTSDKQK